MAPTARSIDLPLPHGRVRIRVATPDDEPALQAGFLRLSDDSRYTRFFTAVPTLSGKVLHQLTDLDGHQRLALAAFDPDRQSEIGTDDGMGIGVGRLMSPMAEPDVAELAVAVIDEYHGRGIGRILVSGLVAAAEHVGFREVRGFVLASNHPMNRLFLWLGADVRHDEEAETGVIEYSFDVATAAARLRATGVSVDVFGALFD